MSGNPKPLSLEVFKDAATPEVDIDPVIDAMQMVRRAKVGIEMVRAARTVKIGTNDRIIPDNINWPSFPADINLVLTKRHIGRSSESSFASLWRDSSVNGHRIGLVKTSETDADIMVAEVIGQLLGVEHEHGNSDNLCVMDDHGLRVARSALSMLSDLESFLRTGKHEQKEIPEVYCQRCASQLGMNAYYLARAKAGDAIPESLIK